MNSKTIKIPGGSVKVDFIPNKPLTFREQIGKIRLMALELDNLTAANKLPVLSNRQKDDIVNTLSWTIKELQDIKDFYIE